MVFPQSIKNLKIYRALLLFFVLIFGWVLASASAYSSVTGLRVSGDKQSVRLVFDLTARPKYHAFYLPNPDRVVIDFSNTRIVTRLNNPSLLNTFVKSIRASTSSGGNARLVLDLKQAVNFKCSWARGADLKSSVRLVIDLFNSGTRASSQVAIVASVPKVVSHDPAQEITPASPKIVASNIKETRPIVVIIDPGHGGKDSGAVGVSGVQEKNVVLSISKYLQYYLNRYGNFRVIMTRSGDYFIPLNERLLIARKYQPDMFIAIHADAYNNNAAGASVFALSQRGATSVLARWIAHKENESELGHVIADKNLIVKSILIDLAQTLNITNSLILGRSILQQLAYITDLHCRHVEQAAFVVLKSPDIPSLLVETGFLSNSREEDRLRTPAYQAKIAEAIAKGIEGYFAEHPPVAMPRG